MTPADFAVRTVPHYDRLSSKLRKAHRDFEPAERRAAVILSADPYNRSRNYDIKKLEGIAAGKGQYRLALGRWRFRYDIVERRVELLYCSLCREDTY